MCIRDRAITSFQSLVQQGNFSRIENLHLTLAFLGETERLHAICQIMEQISLPAFSLTLDQLGRFRRNGGDIYWVGIAANPSLQQLQQSLSQKLRQAKFPLDEKPYRPHLTLGRQIILKPAANLAQVKQCLAPVSFPVSSIHLMESSRRHGQLIYTSRYQKTSANHQP